MDKYFIIPIQKVSEYLDEDVSFGRYSLDGQFLIWDKEWSAEILEKAQNDSDVLILDHDEAIAEMQKPLWTSSENFDGV